MRHIRLAPSRLGLVAIVVVASHACRSDSPVDPVLSSDAALVSDPTVVLAGAAAVPRGPSSSSGSPGVTVSTDVAYVSLAPGAVPDGQFAVIRNKKTAATITVGILTGGFDPVPVEAGVGDSIEIQVQTVSLAIESFASVVPNRRRPVVVRTDPPPRKRDVPLNSSIVIVFNEPIDVSTLNTSSVQLLRGPTAIPGTVELLSGSATAAVFRPAVTLDPTTDYRLVVTGAVRDLSGDALNEPATVDFTTGTEVVGQAHHVFVIPDTTALAIGSQVQLTAIAADSMGFPVTGRPVTWTSESLAVATVTETGLATAVTTGVARIRADVDLGSGFGVVVVSPTLAPVDSVEVGPGSATLPLSGSIALSAITRDAAGNILPFRPVTWATSNPAVATVAMATGPSVRVTSHAPGIATITASSEGRSGAAQITVVTTGPYVKLDVANGHTCGVTTDDWAFCWGWNPYGQLGLGTAVDEFVATPVAVTGGLKFSQVAVKWGNSCGLAPEGVAYCWGLNEYGQMGIGAVRTADDCPRVPAEPGWCGHTPTTVTGALQFSEIHLGYEFACGLATSGRAYCWGMNNEGRLGIGATSGPETCNGQACSTMPVAVAGGLTFASIALGDGGGCGLTPIGAAYCWGDNSLGQIGDGTMTPSASPVPVAGGHTFVQISVGGGHACGITSDAHAYCWGRNDGGELGVGTFEGPEICLQPGGQQPACSRVPVLVPGIDALTSISVGWHSCALNGAGAASCWGPNWYGGLGIGAVSLPLCGITEGNPPCSTTPRAVVGGFTFATLSARAGHTCGVTRSQVAYCWGENNAGQLGIGVADQDRHFVPEKVAGQP